MMSDDGYDSDAPIERRVAAERDEPFVVFHIGLRINAFWKIHRWVAIFLIAPRMVRELVSDPESRLRKFKEKAPPFRTGMNPT